MRRIDPILQLRDFMTLTVWMYRERGIDVCQWAKDKQMKVELDAITEQMQDAQRKLNAAMMWLGGALVCYENGRDTEGFKCAMAASSQLLEIVAAVQLAGETLLELPKGVTQ